MRARKIKEITRNELSFITPYGLKEHTSNDKALELVNSASRKLELNGYVVVSTNKEDLNYINDLFSNVRVKTGYVNSIRFYGVEYATNFDLTYKLRNDKIFTKQERHDLEHTLFIELVDLIKGTKTLEQLETAKTFALDRFNLKHQRAKNNHVVDNIQTIKKQAKEKLINEKLNGYKQFITNYDKVLYLNKADNKLYDRYDILKLNHKELVNA